jgi:hypothetical protein
MGKGHNNFQHLHTLFILLLCQYNAVLKNAAYTVQYIYFYGSYGLVLWRKLSGMISIQMDKQDQART